MSTTNPANSPVVQAIADSWWVVLIRGIAIFLFGIVAIAWPGLTAYFMLLTFGIFAIVDGLFAAVGSFQRKSTDDQWWVWLVEGILSILIGLMALFWTDATAVAIVVWIAAWAIVVGVMRIIAAIRLRKEIDGEWLLILTGALLIIWGILLAMNPGVGLLSLTWVFGIFSIAIGALLIILSFRLKGMKKA